MFGNEVKSGLTMTKVIGGLTKTLNIANQAIPLYKEAKPMINNARNIYSVLKSFANNKNNSFNNNINNKKITYEKKSNNPTFFI